MHGSCSPQRGSASMRSCLSNFKLQVPLIFLKYSIWNNDVPRTIGPFRHGNKLIIWHNRIETRGSNHGHIRRFVFNGVNFKKLNHKILIGKLVVVRHQIVRCDAYGRTSPLCHVQRIDKNKHKLPQLWWHPLEPGQIKRQAPSHHHPMDHRSDLPSKYS
jgi:hypothetical protein